MSKSSQEQEVKSEGILCKIVAYISGVGLGLYFTTSYTVTGHWRLRAVRRLRTHTSVMLNLN